MNVVESPFDGLTIAAPDDWLRAPLAWQAVSAILHWLHARDAKASVFRIEDWHEHDGYVNTAAPTSWDALLAMCASTESLVNSGSDDTYVRIGVFPERRDWYFRFCVEYESEEVGHVIHFDFTSDHPLAMELKAMLESKVFGDCVVENASQYFGTSWGG